MLSALRIEGLATVEELEVELGPGLNVLTGETGAGKSILVDAVSLLAGGRADAGAIRTGRDEAIVEGVLAGPQVVARALELGVPVADGELVVRRTIARSGRGRCHAGGTLATAALLQDLARGIVDVAGQHEQLSLLSRSRHLDRLDAFAGTLALRARHESAFDALAAATRERAAILASEAERARRAEYLAYQLREIEELGPAPGEDAELAAERRKLAAAEKLRAASIAASSLVTSGDPAALDLLLSAAARLDEAAALDPRLVPLLERLRAAAAEVEDAGRTLARHAGSIAVDEDRLAAIEVRLESLRRLARRFGSLDAAIAARTSLQAELSELAASAERLAALEAEIASHGQQVVALARELTGLRTAAARRLSRATQAELGRLAMAGARLEVRLEPPSGEILEADGLRVGRRGAEDAELLLAANTGEAPAPLHRAASGGELSRVMLALRRTLAIADPVATFVFDEVDAGVSGATALVVGRLLREVAADRQVLCVTHLAQVAAFADVHLQVRKHVRGGRTFSSVVRLDGDAERSRELSRLVTGEGGSRAGMAAAAELLSTARRGRRRAA